MCGASATVSRKWIVVIGFGLILIEPGKTQSSQPSDAF
jgi:hypothetical protein